MDYRIAVGLDVHARSVAACGIDKDTGLVFEKTVSSSSGEVIHWLSSLPVTRDQLHVVYEAGPTGFWLARDLTAAGIMCEVAAPSMLLTPPGRRVKTDQVDARHLAGLVMAGLVTSVRIPTEHEEAARDVSRAREDARHDVTAAKHRVSKLLLRHGIVWDKTAWTKEHLAWVSRVRLPDDASQTALDNDMMVTIQALDRRNRLDTVIRAMIPGSQWEPIVTAFGCIRGVADITAFGLAVEIGDWLRFTPTSFASFVGLVPGEDSSGESRRHTRITKAGNPHARTLLIEAAWHHRSAYHPTRSLVLQQRWALAPALIAHRADHANRRLHHQWAKFDHKGKNPNVANTAIARELASFCCDLAQMAVAMTA
jgi:transposase